MDNSLSYMVSNEDLKSHIHFPIKILEYPKLANYENIQDLLPKQMDCVIILIETKLNSGHWTCLFRNIIR